MIMTIKRFRFDIPKLRRAIVVEDQVLNGQVHKIRVKRLGRPVDKRRVEDIITPDIIAIRQEIAKEVIRDMLIDLYGDEMETLKSVPELLRIVASKLEEK